MFQVIIFIVGILTGLFVSKKMKQTPRLTTNTQTNPLNLEGEIK